MAGGSLRLLNSIVHDRFHYPLNCAVLLGQGAGDAHLRFEYDAAQFLPADMDRIGNACIALLGAACGEAWQSLQHSRHDGPLIEDMSA